MPSKKKALTKTQLNTARNDLLDRQAWLRGGSRNASTEDMDRGGDEGDLATSSVNADLALDTKARESRELKQIENALARIEEGTYGKCSECEEVIPAARLQALPFAAFCIDCQERLEEEGSFDEGHVEFRLRT